MGEEKKLDMELSLWDRLGDFFSALSEAILQLLTRLFGSSNERHLRKLGLRITGDPERPYEVVPGSLLARINDLEPRMQALSDDELRALTPQFRERLRQGATLDDILPEAFAACRESARRFKNMRHFDVQILGGIVLHQGKIAEMATGEGKTLVATLPAYLNCLEGRGVHIVTVNDYLARRDCEWMTPIYQGLGVTAGYIQSDMDPAQRRRAYDCDITYGTNSEFGFDYLRDNMKPARWGDPRYSVYEQQCQRELNYAIIDEVDNILIDEARTPLIISGPALGDTTRFFLADRVARQLKPGVHFEVKEKEHTCHLTDEGIREAQRLAGVDSFYTPGNMEWPHLIDQALKAHHLYKRDKHYVVMPHPETGEMSVIIVDEFTGRLMIGRQWSDGLHQAVEAKEGVRIKEETQTLATITIQNFFRLYRKIAGMTGTAMTEADEFWKIYHLEVVAIPTNRPLRRTNYPDVVFRYEREKWKAIVDEIVEVHKSGRPILVGTTSVEKSEKLADMLKKRGVRFELLNAKPEHAAREAEIVAQAGRLGAVTIATNMAGRGTDIILGGNAEFLAWAKLRHQYPTRLDVPPDVWKRTVEEIEAKENLKEEGRKVAELGGLHVIGTERHEARRIDNQLRGRAGRQGDPGSSRFYVSLQDDLMRLFGGEKVAALLTWVGMEEGQSIESPMVTRQIEKAQKRVEERNFDIRKHLLEYDEVMDYQRKKVYGYRQCILEGTNCRLLILGMLREQIERAVRRYYDEDYGAECFAEYASKHLQVELEASDFRRATFEQAVLTARDIALRRAPDVLQEALAEYSNSDQSQEADSEPNWKGLAQFLAARFGLKMTGGELRTIGLEKLIETLLPRIEQLIEAIDLSEGRKYFEPDYGAQALADWLKYKFGLDVRPADFAEREPDEIAAQLWDRILDTYLEKDIVFPVQVGLARFFPERAGAGIGFCDREGLRQWALHRFPGAAAFLHDKDFQTAPRPELKQALLQASRATYPAEAIRRLEEVIHNCFAEHDTLPIAEAQQLAVWAHEKLGLEWTPEDFAGLDRAAVQQKLCNALDDRYRPEMQKLERSLLLSIVDASWKDHLYAMDHLRAGIGLVGYAQVDPKSEYKRQGMKLFDSMWEGVSERVTDLIFRMEEAAESMAPRLWTITETVHAAPVSALQSAGTDSIGSIRAQQQAAIESSQSQRKVETIRNRGVRVGRNDPCPCGSGKKYKQCCMRSRTQ